MPGAGILFTTIHKGKLHFLLGRENKYCSNGKFTYCDFGGGMDDNENYVQTAARECSEEMRGFLGKYNDLLKLLKKTAEYPLYIDNGELPKIYRIFIIPIPYLPYLPVLFNQTCEVTSKYLRSNLLRTSKILEKDRMKWVSINDHSTPLRKFFKESMVKIRNREKEIMDYINTTLPITKNYFNKYTMNSSVNNKTKKFHSYTHITKTLRRSNRNK